MTDKKLKTRIPLKVGDIIISRFGSAIGRYEVVEIDSDYEIRVKFLDFKYDDPKPVENEDAQE